ncbi:hypothetical protein DFP73DRAFT_528195 [Morchella snyderi]|nr:hypothetical protein DFP73DRAFT_528195 [Morchella snyderi]
MSHNQHQNGVRPPYPGDSNPHLAGVQEPHPPSLSQSQDLGEAQARNMTRGPSTESNSMARAGLPDSLRVGSPAAPQISHAPEPESVAKGSVMLPDSLRVGAGSNEGSQRGGETPRGSFEKANMPEALQPGGGKMKMPAANAKVYTHGVPEGENQQPEITTHVAPAQKGVETTMHGILVTGNEDSEDIWGNEKTPIPRRQSEDISSPMAADFNSNDRPFNEYSPFYNPTNNFSTGSSKAPIHSNQTGGNVASEPQRFPPVAAVRPAGDRDRQFSTASSTSSVGFDPGMDLSSFDASTTRAYPGRRGYPAVGMDGWNEDDEEGDVAKTWEEELDRRAKAGAELQRRNEEAQERGKEERLQAEFWEEERRLAGIAEGPQKPPKAPSSTGGDSTARADPQIPQLDQSRPVPPIPVEAMADLNIRSPPPPPPSANTTTEIYQIKHIAWTDPSVPNAKLRRSPILLQNANGPCPLLALVNALILSTPVGTKTALWETLEFREQVSLELLLDAVFQELMDRGGAAGLPDVGDLFAFLLTLHTGMNVNPRFYSEDNPTNTHTMHFEKTREMELYGAFRVPLVHGWLPTPSDPVLAAMKRRAVCNYEEAQTLLFHEAEIISRVTSEDGTLADGEDQIIEDAGIIRDWMERSRTQLTAHGLEIVKSGLKTGDVAILFRNDHFMTVIGGRDSHALMGLVTDMGFAGHEEVVWERMVDVQGRNNEFLSGDFRPVGAGDAAPPPPPRQEVRSLLDPDEGWETIPGVTDTHTPAPGDIVDHDADLALAMQLQEEEDERYRSRQDAEQRQRRHGPSQSMGGQPRGLPPPPPPRNAVAPGQFTHRPADGAETIPPPPYERHPNQPQPQPQPQSQPQPQLSAYQQQQQIQQQQEWAAGLGRGRRASFGATTAPAGIQASGGMSPAQRRAEAARNLMSEIASNAGSPSSSAQQHPGRRSSLGAPGTDGEQKEKCVIC